MFFSFVTFEMKAMFQTKKTHHTAAQKDDKESFDGPSCSDNPCHSDEKDDAEDVLDAWQVDAHESAEVGLFHGLGVRVHGTLLDGGRVVGQGVDEGRHVWTLR